MITNYNAKHQLPPREVIPMLRVIVGAIAGAFAGIGVLQIGVLVAVSSSGSPELQNPDVIFAMAIGFGSVVGAIVGAVDAFKPDRPVAPIHRFVFFGICFRSHCALRWWHAKRAITIGLAMLPLLYVEATSSASRFGTRLACILHNTGSSPR